MVWLSLVGIALFSRPPLTSPGANTRIINGQPVVAGVDPDIVWQVYFLAGNSECGGVIIGEHWIMTAAHCVRTIIFNSAQTATSQVTKPAFLITVVPGLRRDGTDRYNVTDIYIHPTYAVGFPYS